MEGSSANSKCLSITPLHHLTALKTDLISTVQVPMYKREEPENNNHYLCAICVPPPACSASAGQHAHGLRHRGQRAGVKVCSLGI